jgi:NADPH:quinone reductase-like Zn-dependent oxidoreductase
LVGTRNWLLAILMDQIPFVLGADVAGEVVEIGGAVTGLTVGDSVVGHAVEHAKSRTTQQCALFN